jgi:penicillin-binding protein 2
MSNGGSLSRAATWVLAGAFMLVVGFLFNLQVIQGAKYRRISERNYVRIVRINAVRGEIYDRKYKPIVLNSPCFNLYFDPGKIRDKDALADLISGIFPMSRDEVLKLVKANRFLRGQDILVTPNVDYQTYVLLSERMNYFPELSFRVESIRQYLLRAHFLGHVGRVDEKEYAKLRDQGYAMDDIVGKKGLEKYYEKMLRGSPGYRVLQVDASGRSLNFLKHNLEKKPVAGDQLVLALDADLQRDIQNLFTEGMQGAAVAMDVRTGGILTYVSMPNYDQNIFMNRISADVWSSLVNDPGKPLLDRVIQASYPPGSAFKAVTGSVGLEEGKIDAHTLLAPCVGGMQYGNRFYRCWSSAGHGCLPLTDALMVSCDVFFYSLSTRLDLDRWRWYVDRYGLIDKTGIDLTDEKGGFFPSVAWYKKTQGQHVGIRGRMLNLAIGQGEVLVTPLQLCAYYAALANSGYWKRPRMFLRVLGKEAPPPDAGYKIPISDEHMALIRQGLWKVVNGPSGTGGRARSTLPGVVVYGKTGSSQNAMGQETHAWFAGFAEFDGQPEIAFAILLENAGHGGSISAPIGGEIVDYYAKNVRIKP